MFHVEQVKKMFGDKTLSFEKKVIRGFELLDIPIKKEVADKLYIFSSQIKKWNESFHLISKNDVDRILEAHILDSLTICKVWRFEKNNMVMDIGTGCGFPGIPIKLLFEEITLFLIDSSLKKEFILKEIKRELKLQNTEIMRIRASSLLEKKGLFNKFNFLLFRAAGSCADYLDVGKNLLRPEGKMVFIKGKGIEEELTQIKDKLKRNKIEFLSIEKIKSPFMNRENFITSFIKTK